MAPDCGEGDDEAESGGGDADPAEEVTVFAADIGEVEHGGGAKAGEGNGCGNDVFERGNPD